MLKYEILVDHTETTKKCTILPLRDRKDFDVWRFHTDKPQQPLSAEILLHPDGITLDKLPLSTKQSVTKIAALDCIWRRLDIIMNKLVVTPPTLVSIPPGFETAYPRKSKVTPDPLGGLATIEAIFIAAAFLDIWDTTLLSEYYFGDQFLEKNASVFQKYGLCGNDAR